ncbi:hypothetical protein OG921_12985 [Aldersonia sp. NBC_00410]|uniref:hypothetical protein n=1 Tax=Aldersonia sp. NBC_00410 TaxID=2975954 RepID=UPI00224D8B3C|nr:hypothetical protein [Aldersonia sp. NBC_00410]MCX5044080.1 hypothetical protein [Aldersonia sp. NBC_00410]
MIRHVPILMAILTVGAVWHAGGMQFGLDALPERTWPALRFGEPWNGWATPVVSRDVLDQMLAASGEPHRWEGSGLWLGTPAIDVQPGQEPEFYERVRASGDGSYDLGQLGWTFVAVDAL